MISCVETLASTIVGETFALLFLQNMSFLKNPILTSERKELWQAKWHLLPMTPLK